MLNRDYRDIVAGAALVAFGLFVGIYASRNYDLGTLRHIGPGMFPSMLGYVLAALGVIVLLAALFRAGPAVATPAFRPLSAVLAGLLAFALTIEPFGMVPAIFLLVGIVALADDRLGPIGIVIFAALMSLLVILIFQVGLQLPIDSFKWPF
jgi:hypothetical protein